VIEENENGEEFLVNSAEFTGLVKDEANEKIVQKL
jgi:hypothetical protein